VTATDAAGNATTQTVSLTIDDVNEAPTATPVTLSAIAEDSGARLITQAELLANANDVDGDTLTATGLAISTGAGTLVDNGNGTWTYTPASNDDSSVAFSYTITDGTASVAGSATLDITPLNDDLVAVADAYSTPEDTALTITASDLATNDTDPEGDALTVTNVGGAVNGAVSLVAGTITFTPTANFSGPASFTYTVSDSNGGSATGTVNIIVAPVNDPPAPGNNSFLITPDSTTVLSDWNLSATDVESAAGTLEFTVNNVVNGRFELVAAPGTAIGSFTQAQILLGQVQFVHTGGGAPSFDLAVSDGSALTGPYAGNIVFDGGTTPPAPGGGGVVAPIAGLFDAGTAPPTSSGDEFVFASTPVSALVLPTPRIGLLDRFGIEFLRTPAIGASAVSEGSASGFAGPGLAQVRAGAIDAKVGANRDLPPIRAQGDVIETHVDDLTLRVERFRAEELEVKPSEYAHACVPETIDPIAPEMTIVPTERRVEPDAEGEWRLNLAFGAFTVAGLTVAAGALWWAARASGLISGLLAASPARRPVDPRPALGRDDDNPQGSAAARKRAPTRGPSRKRRRR
jgi:hypothetical protein